MTLVFFDLETSGLDRHRHQIIQIAAIAYEWPVAGDELRQQGGAFNALLEFDLDIADPEALELNSYDPDRWAAEAHPQHDALALFCRWLRPHCCVERVSQRTGRPYTVARLAGHNAAGFDLPFLITHCQHHNIFLPADFIPLDTLQLAAWHYSTHPAPENLKLPTLYHHLTGEHLVDAHDALADVRANALVAQHLLQESSK